MQDIVAKEEKKERAILIGLSCTGLQDFDNSDEDTMDELNDEQQEELFDLLSADEQDALALHRNLTDEGIGLVDLANGLRQVDDVDAIALGEDVRSHLRVPAAGLVAKVHASLEQLLHRDNCHGKFPPFI